MPIVELQQVYKAYDAKVAVQDLSFRIEPGSMFGLLGPNGSGKTTAADAIQTVMTAAHENLFHYNPGQDESTQRGRGGKRVRTLASYVLGCDDGSYARIEATDGYIAAITDPASDMPAKAKNRRIAILPEKPLLHTIAAARVFRASSFATYPTPPCTARELQGV